MSSFVNRTGYVVEFCYVPLMSVSPDLGDRDNRFLLRPVPPGLTGPPSGSGNARRIYRL
ncbi:hypothetical protein [Nonomuraea mesophila]|uniref:hypothetical protein n=1 Tax=Nonomuraea mesophila TaxID=2530382 RepID=UPI00140B5328|nr:hypothetical protein [Nonomuraea mesophila]